MTKKLIVILAFSAAVIACASAYTSSLPSSSSTTDKSHDGDKKGWGFGGSESSNLMFLMHELKKSSLPVGLSTVLNDVITELNSTLQSQSKSGRSGKSNFDSNAYGMWNPQASSKIDVLSLIPTLLIVGLGIMLLPVIITCFTQIVAPLTYAGRRKREASDSQFPFEKNIMLGLLTTLENAMSKFGNK